MAIHLNIAQVTAIFQQLREEEMQAFDQDTEYPVKDGFAALPDAGQTALMNLSLRDAREWVSRKRADPSWALYLASLDALHNSLAPANQLANETLSEIFWHVQSELDLGEQRQWAKAITMTCRYWRAVALSSPKLWHIIDARLGTRCARAYLRRSKDALVDISHMEKLGDVSTLLATITPHAEHIRSLRMSDLAARDMANLLSRLTFSMPRLEVFELYTDPSRPGWERLQLDPFPNQFPVLRDLTIACIFVPWASPILRGLVRLEMHYTRKGSEPSMDVFLDVLAASADSMEELILYHAGPRARSQHARVVSLPKLRHLSLSNEPIHVQDLLRHLAVPAGVFIRIQVQGLFGRQGAHLRPLAAVLPSDRTHLANLADVGYIRVTVDYDVFWLYAATRSGDDSGTARFLLSLNDLRADSLAAALPQTLHEVAEVFAVSPVVELQVGGCRNILTEDLWRYALRRFPRLERLRVGLEGECLPLMEALRDAADSVICPALQELYLREVKLDGPAADEVVRCLASRASRGKRLDKLAVAGNVDAVARRLGAEKVRNLQRLVGSLERVR